MNIEFMRAFAQYRSILQDNRELRRELRSLDPKLSRTMKELIERIDDLTAKALIRDVAKTKPVRRIGSSNDTF